MNLAIIGAGSLGVQIAHLAEKIGYKIVGYFDDSMSPGTFIHGYQILGGINDIIDSFKKGTFSHLVCGIGYKHFAFREYIYENYKIIYNIPFATLIDPSCIIDKTAYVGEGCVLYAGSIIDENVSIGCNVLLNLGVCISHNSIIGSHSYLSPRSAIAGNVNISSRCFVGINATIIDDVVIADDITIAGGAVVISDCNKKGLYAGVPAKFKKEIVNYK